MERTIGVTVKTKQLFDLLARGKHHDYFVSRLLHLWQATPADEREKRIQEWRRNNDRAT